MAGDYLNVEAVAPIVDSLITDNMSDYEKMSACFNWICDNLPYGSEKLVMSSDPYQIRSTNDVLCDGEATCLENTLLLQTMANYAEIDNVSIVEESLFNLGGYRHFFCALKDENEALITFDTTYHRKAIYEKKPFCWSLHTSEDLENYLNTESDSIRKNMKRFLSIRSTPIYADYRPRGEVKNEQHYIRDLSGNIVSHKEFNEIVLNISFSYFNGDEEVCTVFFDKNLTPASLNYAYTPKEGRNEQILDIDANHFEEEMEKLVSSSYDEAKRAPRIKEIFSQFQNTKINKDFLPENRLYLSGFSKLFLKGLIKAKQYFLKGKEIIDAQEEVEQMFTEET